MEVTTQEYTLTDNTKMKVKQMSALRTLASQSVQAQNALSRMVEELVQEGVADIFDEVGIPEDQRPLYTIVPDRNKIILLEDWTKQEEARRATEAAQSVEELAKLAAEEDMANE